MKETLKADNGSLSLDYSQKRVYSTNNAIVTLYKPTYEPGLVVHCKYWRVYGTKIDRFSGIFQSQSKYDVLRYINHFTNCRPVEKIIDGLKSAE